MPITKRLNTKRLESTNVSISAAKRSKTMFFTLSESKNNISPIPRITNNIAINFQGKRIFEILSLLSLNLFVFIARLNFKT